MNEQQQSNGMNPLVPRPDQSQLWRSYEKTPIPFDQAYEQVMEHHRADGERRDIPINGLRSWAFGSLDGTTMAIRPLPLPGRKHDVVVPIRSLAWRHLCGRIDAPVDYLSRMPAKVQMACVNWDLSKVDKDALLRIAGNEARAMLSDRYAPIDDVFYLDLVNETLKTAGYRDDALVRVVASGPQTIVRVTIPNDAIEVKKGDAIEHGIDIGNSELGMRSVQVTPITYRLVCTNGARAWKSEATHRMRHVGDPARLREQLADAVPVAFAEAKGTLDKWHKATERLIDNALEEIEGLHSFGLNKPEREAIGRQLVADTGLPGRNLTEQLMGTRVSVFDMANAITAYARNRGAGEDNSVRVESRLHLEEVGAEYLHRKVA